MPNPLIPDAALGTEALHPEHAELDRYDVPALLGAFVEDQAQAAAAVHAALPALARVVEQALPRLRRGGRLIYVGAGTSGRLGVLDSAELPPTFSWPPQRALGLLAGGAAAMFRSAEGVEDDVAQGRADLAAVAPSADDVVLLIAASGGTPYTRGALQAARAAGALSVGIVNNPATPIAEQADLAVVLDTGPEVISGSTRLKAGTAQKIALNALSSALMVRLNKVHGHLMVDLRASNAKLQQRALRLVRMATGAEAAQAEAALKAADSSVKTAIVMLAAGLDAAQARRRLDAADGSVRGALAGDAEGA
jgi:N-acetylmuramic acid 6-phosphate etherase